MIWTKASGVEQGFVQNLFEGMEKRVGNLLQEGGRSGALRAGQAFWVWQVCLRAAVEGC